jgi:hypothetical protein
VIDDVGTKLLVPEETLGGILFGIPLSDAFAARYRSLLRLHAVGITGL